MQPLEAARLFTSALTQQNNLNDDQLRIVDNLKRSLSVASGLLSDLGEIARIESGNITPVITAVDLYRLFEELENEFSATATELGVEFRVVKKQLWVASDVKLLRRILQNLIGNAFRYASPGKVLLGVKEINKQVHIHVLDNGPGIPVEKQALVFEQFTQLDRDGGQQGKGLGLGLNITQSLSALLGHQLGLKSQSDEGCKFTISLAQAEAEPKQETPSVSTPSSFNGITVLCIDNDPDVLEGMSELLNAWQCNVLIADSFEHAKTLFERHASDIEILLVDYQLNNNLDGLTLISELRDAVNHYLPAILITATTEEGIDQKAEEMDVGFMRKMVKPAALRAMISAMLAKRLHDKFS